MLGSSMWGSWLHSWVGGALRRLARSCPSFLLLGELRLERAELLGVAGVFVHDVLADARRAAGECVPAEVALDARRGQVSSARA